jgi:hypothetical protein
MNEQGAPDIKINEVVTDMTVTEGVGALSPEEVKTLVGLVLAQVRAEQDRMAQRQRDTGIRDRAYTPRVGD